MPGVCDALLIDTVQTGHAGSVDRVYWLCKALARLFLPKDLRYQDLSYDRRLLLGFHHMLDYCLRVRDHLPVHSRLNHLDRI